MEEVRAVVGKYRHAWIEGRVLEEAEVVEWIAENFVKLSVNGGKEEGSTHSEFMPVGADGRVVLSFNLLNADWRDWMYDWDFQEIDETLLAPFVEALRPLAEVTVESQVLYHTPKSSSLIGMTSRPATSSVPKISLSLYIPSQNDCPLLLQLPHGDFSMTNGFISPVWGGVVVWNPPACLNDFETKDPLRRKISPEELKKVFEVFMGQLRQLFGLKSDSLCYGASGTSILLAGERGFAEWELDVLS